jgi:hypothetical protein
MPFFQVSTSGQIGSPRMGVMSTSTPAIGLRTDRGRRLSRPRVTPDVISLGLTSAILRPPSTGARCSRIRRCTSPREERPFNSRWFSMPVASTSGHSAVENERSGLSSRSSALHTRGATPLHGSSRAIYATARRRGARRRGRPCLAPRAWRTCSIAINASTRAAIVF